jgi:hypothetical protein
MWGACTCPYTRTYIDTCVDLGDRQHDCCMFCYASVCVCKRAYIYTYTDIQMPLGFACRVPVQMLSTVYLYAYIMHVCTRTAYMHTYNRHICTHTHARTCTQTLACMHVCMHACTHARRLAGAVRAHRQHLPWMSCAAHICVHIHTYEHSFVLTYTHRCTDQACLGTIPGGCTWVLMIRENMHKL